MDHLYIIVFLNGKELYFSTKTLIELKQKKKVKMKWKAIIYASSKTPNL